MKNKEEIKAIKMFIKNLEKTMIGADTINYTEDFGIDTKRKLGKHISELKGNNTMTIKIEINGGCVDRRIAEIGMFTQIERERRDL